MKYGKGKKVFYTLADNIISGLVNVYVVFYNVGNEAGRVFTLLKKKVKTRLNKKHGLQKAGKQGVQAVHD